MSIIVLNLGPEWCCLDIGYGKWMTIDRRGGLVFSGPEMESCMLDT